MGLDADICDYSLIIFEEVGFEVSFTYTCIWIGITGCAVFLHLARTVLDFLRK